MKSSYLFDILKERKVLLCVVAGILFLLLCLAITYNYFGIRDFDKSKLIHYAENLANGLQEGKSLKDWIFSQTDTAELWMKDNVELAKQAFLKKISGYLKSHVDWCKIWLVIISFIATCLLIFEFFRTKMAKIVGEDRAPFNWKLDTGIISKFTNLKSWQPILKYVGDEFTKFSDQTISKAKKGINSFIEKGIVDVSSDLLSFIKDDLEKADFGDSEVLKTFFTKINLELSKSPLLFLIDKVSSNDHFALFWELAVKEFRTRDIKTDYYFFHADPRLCFSEADENGIFISKIAERHPESILVVIGDAGMLFQSDACQLRPWTQVFLQWKTRFLFTPRNYFSWGRRETLLKDLFHVLPAKFSSLKHLGNKPNAEESVKFVIGTETHEHAIDYEEDIFNEHTLQKYFGSASQPETDTKGDEEIKIESRPLLDWIQSCAIHKNLSFQLSLELGKAIFDRHEGLEMTPEAILSVFQLPWFRTGKIDDPIRVLIAKKFDEKSSDTSGYVRKFLEMKLPQWKPPKDSFAGDAVTETEQINQWKIKDPEPDSATRRKVKEELNKIYDRGIEPDRILTVTDGIHNRYSKYFHSRLRPIIFSHGYSGLGLARRFRNSLYSLLAGLILFLLYCMIIWLSRPLIGSPPCPECPPASYFCVPITKTIAATKNQSKKIILTGEANKPLLAYLTGNNDDCCVSIKIVGSGVKLMQGKDSIGWSADTVADIRQLMQDETLRMEIKDRVEITVMDSVALTVFASLFDSIEVQEVNMNHDLQHALISASVLRFSRAHKICPTLISEVKDSIIRSDTLWERTTSDTSFYKFLIKCPEPDTMVIKTADKNTFIIYQCGSIGKTVIIRDTIRYDSIEVKIIQVGSEKNPCPPLSLNLSCVGKDLGKLGLMPTLYLNGEVIIGAPNFTNPVQLPRHLTKNHILKFTLDPPYKFTSGNSELVTWLDKAQGEIGLDIYKSTPRDTTLQVSGDVIVLNSTPNGWEKIEILDDSLELWHCNFGQFVEIIKHTNGVFCHDINNFSFCDSQIIIKWNGLFYGYKLLRDYEEIRRCSDEAFLCADFGSIAIRLNQGKSLELLNCCEGGPASIQHN